MSASREKKLRQDQTASGYVDPKAEKELEEKKAVLKLIDAFTLSQYTAKKLFDYHLESKQDPP